MNSEPHLPHQASHRPIGQRPFEVVILLGRGMPLGEQRRSLPELGAHLVAGGYATRFEIAFAELSDPPLLSVLEQLRDEGASSCVIVPVIIPFDRNLRGWIGRWVSRWSTDQAGQMRVVFADPVDGAAQLLAGVADAVSRAANHADVRDAIKPLKIKAGASRVPDIARMALVCLGPRCAQAGGIEIYDRLRRRFGPHKPEGLDEDPLLCLSTNCQGPCNFAPLVAVQPENIWYGRLTGAAIDTIADRHFAHGGAPVAPWALQPGERLRLDDGSLAEPDLPFASAAAGSIRIERLFARKAMIEDNALAAFMDIANSGLVADRLLAIDCHLSTRIAVHAAGGHDELATGNGLPLAVGERSAVSLRPGQLHVMLLDVAELPDAGAQIDLSFRFEKAGRIDTRCFVHAPA